MQLAQALKAQGVNVFPCALYLDNKKGRYVKQPITPKDVSWQDVARQPLESQGVDWSSIQAIGIPIPDDIVVIDLDTYKQGCDPALLGIDEATWQRAHIQSTVSGGQHYAFRLPAWTVRQGSDLCGKESGIDTRVAGLGFICSGSGYSPSADGMGVLKLAYSQSLPVLPENTRGYLENCAPTAPVPTELPTGDRDSDAIKAALAFIDPTERDTWRNTGFSLKHHYHDDEATGYALWDAWSRGDYWAGGSPPTYAEETQPGQWASFQAVKPGATITIGSLFHAAVKAGWVPPAKFDVSQAFGDGPVNVEGFQALSDRILAEGINPVAMPDLMAAIQSSGLNEVQVLILRNQLKAMVKEAGVLDKTLTHTIDKATTPQGTTAPATPGQYGKNHTENAEAFLHTYYSGGGILRKDEVFYRFNGVCWESSVDDSIKHQVAKALQPSRPSAGTINGTADVIKNLVYRDDVDMLKSPDGLIVFNNGVLDLNTWTMSRHDRNYFTTKAVPYDYNPIAQAPTWLNFLNEIFEGDPERIALLQEWLGYMVSPSYEYQKIMLLLGPQRCGKGTIGSILADLVGDLNYTGASLRSFCAEDFLESCMHKTVAFSGDTAKNVSRSEVDAVIETIKKVSGNDAVDFKRKYKGRMTCKLPTRITLAANHIPRLFDDSDALSGRLLVLPFNVSFFGREDPSLLSRLRAELSGIATWALVGLDRLKTAGRFTEPAESKKEHDFIAESYSPLRAFIGDVCALTGDKADRVECEDVYQAYHAWAVTRGEDHILNRKTFVSSFKDTTRGKGPTYGAHRMEGHDKPVRGFTGLRIGKVESLIEKAFRPEVVKP